jgi:hypothetical protein
LCSAFPFLQSLDLQTVEFVSAPGLASLAACTQLKTLKIRVPPDVYYGDYVHVPKAAAPEVAAAAAVLSSLPTLVSVSLGEGITISPVSQLTNLTHLEFGDLCQATKDVFAAVPATPRLQYLSVSSSGTGDWDQSWLLQRLLRRCPSLTHLALPYASINQQGLDTLLQDGTKITRLEVLRITPVQDRSTAPCSWRHLELRDFQRHQYFTASEAADLPLHTVQQLREVAGVSFDAAGGEDCIPALMHKAACNLGACPAVRQKSWEGCLRPNSDRQGRWSLTELLAALAPLRAVQPNQFSMIGRSNGAPLEAAEVQAIAESLGSNIQKLWIDSATLATSFWAALPQLLPRLTTLVLEGRVKAQPRDICLYCKALPAVPFHLRLRGALYDELYEGTELEASLSAWGATHVQVTFY